MLYHSDVARRAWIVRCGSPRIIKNTIKLSSISPFLLLAGASASALPTPIANKSGLLALSVTELKRLLVERGVDFRDCLEKQDLVRRLEEHAVSHKFTNEPSATPNDSLTSEEELLIKNFKRVSPSVAFITTTVKAAPRGFSLSATEIPVGTGSGFLWDTQGHVVTNYHVLAGGTGRNSVPSSCKVKLAGMANAVEAKVVGAEPDKDLAVVKIDPRSLPSPLAVGTSNDLQVGQSVLAIGNPFGLDNTLTKGIVSATGRDVQAMNGRTIRDCVQTDAAINPGNSGGPLLDSSGRLIGVNTAIYSPSGGGNVGIGFAIPVDTVRRVVIQIIRHGRVERPTLGIHVLDDQLVRTLFAQLRRPLEGVLVADILHGSPLKGRIQETVLHKDGSVRLGDVITHVNDQPVKQVEDLLAAIEEHNGGDVVKLRVQRRGKVNDIDSIRVRLVSRTDYQ